MVLHGDVMMTVVRRARTALQFGVPKSWRRCMVYLLTAVTAGALFMAYRQPRRPSIPVTFLQRPVFVSEREVNSDQYNVELLSYANASLSKLFVEKGQGHIYGLGDVIHVKIKLFDGYGRPKTRGGDLVRLWLRDIPQSACSNGHVIDNKDGTYNGVLRADWIGTPDIIAAIAGSRETVKLIYNVLEHHKTFKYIHAIFIVNGETQQVEETNCLPFPDVPGYAHVCNFTAENYGLPWYCGQPVTKEITCFDWQHIVYYNNSGNLPLTKEESFIFSRQNLHTQLTPHKIWVKNTASNKNTYSQPDTMVPCNQRPALDTWGDVSPVGFFLQSAWVPSHCYLTIETVADYDTCLRDRRVLIYGDSTTRQWFVHLRQLLKLTMATEYFEDAQPWHKPCLADNPVYNYSVFWGPHEMPFYGGPNRGFNRPTFVYLDELPNNSRDIVIIHYYLHFASFHPSVFIRHMRRLYKSVESLLSRAPNVTVAIKGPHALTDLPGRLDDYWGPIYDNIIRNTFRPIMHKVLYLDYWDMTVASENDSIHPNDTIVSNMVHYMMNTACRKMKIS